MILIIVQNLTFHGDHMSTFYVKMPRQDIMTRTDIILI